MVKIAPGKIRVVQGLNLKNATHRWNPKDY